MTNQLITNLNICCISDTHTKHREVEKDLIDADIIVHAGDICSHGYYHQEIVDFLDWYSSLKQYQYKILIAGNHDRLFETNATDVQNILNKYPEIDYLQNSGINRGGVNFWGSPYQPRFFNWAFNKDRGADIKREWDKIPDNIDVLITHGPPKGHGDKVMSAWYNPIENVGCEDLLNRVNEIKPKYHIFGHIHDGYGQTSNDDTTFINASMLDDNYKYSHKPILIQL